MLNISLGYIFFQDYFNINLDLEKLKYFGCLGASFLDSDYLAFGIKH